MLLSWRRAGFLPLLGLLFTGGIAHAGTYTGNSAYGRDTNGNCVQVGNDNGDFNDPKNWGGACTPGSVPGPGTTADLTGHIVHGTNVNVGTLVTHGGSLSSDSITCNILNMDGGNISGTNASSSAVKVNSQWNITQGTITSTTLTLGPKCVTVMAHDYDNAGSGSYYKAFNGGAIVNNQGVFNWSGAGITGGGTLNNSGVFKMLGDGIVGSVSAGTGIGFVNASTGTFTKIGGQGTTGLGAGSAFINNGGHLQAKTGIFSPDVAYSNTTTLTDGSTIDTGAGVVLMGNGWAVNGIINVKGTLRIDGGVSIGHATYNGAGKIDWRSGGFSADANTSSNILAADMHTAMTGTGGKLLGVLTNLGLLTWNGGANSGGTLTNKGTFNLLNDGDFSGFSVINFGTIAKTGGTGSIFTGMHHLDNKGVIDIQKGTLQLNGNVNGGNDYLRSGTQLKGAGKLAVYYSVLVDGTIDVNTTLQLDDASSGGANLVGPANFTGTGPLNIYGGSLNGIALPATMTTNLLGTFGKLFSGANDAGTPCSNAGVLNWRTSPGISFNGTFINTGTYNVLASGNFGSGSFNNKGTINTFGGTSQFSGNFANNGVMNLGNATKPGVAQFYSGDNNSFRNTGKINAFIQSDKVGHFSQIQGLSDANAATHLFLGGTLVLKTDPAFTITAAAQIPLVKVFPDRAGYEGTFATVTGIPTFNGRSFKLFYNPLDVTLGLPLNLAGLTIRYVDGNIQNIAGSTITVTSATGATYTATTGDNGRGTISGLPAGTYTVSASNGSIRFDSPSKKVVLPSTGLIGSPDAVAMFQTFSASASVVDSAGAPVAGVTFTVSGNGISRSVVTDSAGIALFPDLGTGTFTLTPSAQAGFIFTPTSGSTKLPTTNMPLSPNGLVEFVRKATAAAAAVKAPSGHSG